MRVVKPIDIIANGELLGSNLALYDYPVYSNTTTYATGQKVTYSNQNYEAIANTLNQSPLENPLAWLNIGVTNIAAPFDEKIGTKAVNAAQINYTIKPLDLVSVIALLNVSAVSVLVKVTDAVEGVVYQRTISLSDSAVTDWHSYFFKAYENKSVAIFDDLPAYAGADIDITADSAGTVEIGTLISGYHSEIGEAKWGLSLGITDYSRKSRDAFGNAILLKRAYSSKANAALDVPSDRVDKVIKILTDLRATPCLYLVARNYESSYVYGYFKDFNVTIQNVASSTCNIEIEGLI